MGSHTKGGAGNNSGLINSDAYRQSRDHDAQTIRLGDTCTRCGAWSGELGSEPTPEAFVAHLVECVAAVHRVLRDDGTLWVNLGDTYYTNPGGQNGGAGNTLDYGAGRISKKAVAANAAVGRAEKVRPHPYLAEGDLCGIPGMFERAMQANGWTLRARCAWLKQSPLPESVSSTRWERCRVKVAGQKVSPPGTYKGDAYGGEKRQGAVGYDPAKGGTYFDSQAEWAPCPGCAKCAATDGLVLRRGRWRPTTAWEPVLLFSKKRARYFADGEAVRVGLATPPHAPGNRKWPDDARQDGNRLDTVWGNGTGRNLWSYFRTPEPMADAFTIPGGGSAGQEEHYASFSIGLPKLLLQASTSPAGCCPVCGAALARVVESRFVPQADVRDRAKLAKASTKGMAPENGWGDVPRGTVENTTRGWRPTCSHPEAATSPRPMRVLDPFAGSGTTLLAAEQLGLDSVGIDLNSDYAEMASRRLAEWDARRSGGGRDPATGAVWATLALPLTLDGPSSAPPPDAPDGWLLDQARPQARRALQLAAAAGLTDAHIRAIVAVGITDVGKARVTQNGTDRNAPEVRRLAGEAKDALRGYYREFVGARRGPGGWMPQAPAPAQEAAG